MKRLVIALSAAAFLLVGARQGVEAQQSPPGIAVSIDDRRHSCVVKDTWGGLHYHRPRNWFVAFAAAQALNLELGAGAWCIGEGGYDIAEGDCLVTKGADRYVLLHRSEFTIPEWVPGAGGLRFILCGGVPYSGAMGSLIDQGARAFSKGYNKANN